MFTPAEMAEVDIFVFDDDAQVVAQTVAQLGTLHLLDVNTLGKWAENVGTEWSARVAVYATQERRVRDLLKRLSLSADGASCEGELDPAHDMQAIEQTLVDADTASRELVDREEQLKGQLENWQLIAKSMETLDPLSVSISDLRQLGHLHMVVGTMPAENVKRLEESLFRIPYTIIPVHRYGSRVLVFAFGALEHAPILDRALESAFLQPLQLPQSFGGRPQEVLKQVAVRILDVQGELAEVAKQRAELSERMRPALEDALTRVQRDGAIADAMAHFGHRGRVYLMAGWVPKDHVEELKTAVEDVTNGRVTVEENPADMPSHTRVPTLLRNPRLLKPVEKLVSTYGLPGYREIDPTLLVGITFVLMFGIMFGDLGHGMTLVLLGVLLLASPKVMPSIASMAGFGAILVACGLSSSLFGVLYGSLFGMEDVIRHLWLQPMKDIWTLLGASVVLGVLILNVGFGCRLATAVRAGHVKQAVFDKNGAVGLALYWGLLGIVLAIATGRSVPSWLSAAVVLLVLALFAAEPLSNLISGRRPLVHGSVAELLVQAFFELFEALIGYISNTLSYVRLGAFAVAHAGLSMVVFLLADMIGGGNPHSVARLTIIVLGNIAVIGFEGLIVAIQTLRLEYYELFGKFFVGNGIPFKPLTLPRMDCQPSHAPNHGEK
jgi:V/A-type H+-transporting ATPase subunit I